MDDLDTALLIYLEDESSEDERLEESQLFKCRSTEGAFSILVVRRLHCNEEKFREYFRLTPARDQRGRQDSANKTAPELLHMVEEFCKKLPTCQCHYSTAENSDKVHLPPGSTWTGLYESLQDYMEERGLDRNAISLSRFIAKVRDCKISITAPKSCLNMVRNRKRKTSKGSSSAETMAQAVAKVLSGSTIRAAANEYGVARNTLQRYAQKAREASEGETVKLQPNYACRRVFSDDEEESFKNYLVTCSNKNSELSRKKVRLLAYKVALQKGKKVPQKWHENKIAGEEWLYGFMKRNPSLSTRTPNRPCPEPTDFSPSVVNDRACPETTEPVMNPEPGPSNENESLSASTSGHRFQSSEEIRRYLFEEDSSSGEEFLVSDNSSDEYDEINSEDWMVPELEGELK